MVQSLRVFAVVAVTFLAAVGCQKGTQSAAKGEAESSAVSTDSKGGETQAKEGKSDVRTADASAGGSQVGVKGSTLTEADDGAEVDLRVGQLLTVVLESNQSAGLSWAMAKPTETVIVPEGKPVYAATSDKAAADASTGTETWRFRAAKRGQQTVRLEYLRGWQQSAPERTFRFTATVR
jgi:predicted secreted protein